MQMYTLTVTSNRDPIATFPIRPCSYDDPSTRGIKLRTIDLALMLYLEHEWKISVSPLLPSDCAWIVLENPPPVICHLWMTATGSESESEYEQNYLRLSGSESESESEQNYLRLSGSESPDRMSGATEAEFDSDSEGLATWWGADYHRTVSKIWIRALSAFGHQQQAATAKELRMHYDFLDCQRDLFFAYHEFDSFENDRRNVTEQLLAVRRKLDNLNAEVTSTLELHQLLVVRTAYAANERLSEHAYVSYL